MLYRVGCRLLIAIAMASSLSACSSIGTVNGQQLDQSVSDHPQICAGYEWFCIGAGIAAFGGVVWALQENGHHGN